MKAAAITYSDTIEAMAASGALSIPVSTPGTSRDSNQGAICGPINCPPSNTPKMIDVIVSPSIQPLALTSCEGGNSSVRMPYLAGE